MKLGILSKNTKFPFKAKKKERDLCVLYLLGVIYLTGLYYVTTTIMFFFYFPFGYLCVIYDVL